MTQTFVVHEHQARTHHFDFRLEKDTVLRFENGQDILDLLFRRGMGPKCTPDTAHPLLLDITLNKLASHP